MSIGFTDAVPTTSDGDGNFTLTFIGRKAGDLVFYEEIRKKMSQNGWEFVKDRFHYLTLCKKMEKLYLDLYQNKKKNENQ